MKSIEIWKNRPNNSGLGSRGLLAKFKADFVNNFIKENNIETLFDFGCGDLHNSSMIEVSEYLGIDIVGHKIPKEVKADSFRTAVSRFDEFVCEEPADMTLCMDVLYHILNGEEEYLKATLEKLVECSKRYIVIYAQDSKRTDLGWENVEHMHNGPWRQLLEKHNVKLIQQQAKEDYGTGPSSEAVFFVYEKRK